MKRIRHTMTTAILAAALSSGGCIAPHQAIVTDIDPKSWVHPAGLVLRNTDSVTLRDMEIFVRHNNHFQDDTLTVEITMLSPDTLRHREFFLLHLPQQRTTAAALTQETVIPYRRKVRFPHGGNYRMIIAPTRTTAGIEAIGINLVKSN